MSSDNIAIRVQDLSKCYLIYDRPEDRLKQSVYPRLQRLFGMEPKSYGREFWALKNVSFEVKKGETIGIIGRNGSGKSTLLQLICSTLTSTSGSVETNGRIAALLELGSGFNPEFTGRENVYMNAAILGLSKKEIDARYDDIVAFADIGEFIEQPVKFYSSGMFARLAFATAINVDPDILIVDEILAVGDIRFQVKCYSKLSEFRNNGKTILFVSHSTDVVAQLCSEVCWIDGGCMKMHGDPKTMTLAYHAFMVHDVNAKNINQQNQIESDGARSSETLWQLEPISPNAYWDGEGGALVTMVGLFDKNGKSVNILEGGEHLSLIYEIHTREHIAAPFLSFMVMDNRGLRIFGSSTIVQQKQLQSLPPNSRAKVRFNFVAPELHNADYIISIGVNDGTQDNHIRHQFITGALMIKYQNQSPRQKQSVLIKLPECTSLVETF